MMEFNLIDAQFIPFLVAITLLSISPGGGYAVGDP